jgi:hypothetical protein
MYVLILFLTSFTSNYKYWKQSRAGQASNKSIDPKITGSLLDVRALSMYLHTCHVGYAFLYVTYISIQYCTYLMVHYHAYSTQQYMNAFMVVGPPVHFLSLLEESGRNQRVCLSLGPLYCIVGGFKRIIHSLVGSKTSELTDPRTREVKQTNKPSCIYVLYVVGRYCTESIRQSIIHSS